MSNSNNILQHLGQLAKEYDRKSRELEEYAQSASPDALKTQVKALGERTTDRFRAAQQALFAILAESESTDEHPPIEALMALSSCFDEMRVLHQMMLERFPPV